MNVQMCVPMCIHAEARAGLWIFVFAALQFTSFRQSLPLNGRVLSELGWPASKSWNQPISTHKGSNLKRLYTHTIMSDFLHGYGGIWTQVLMLAEHSFYSLNHLPSPWVNFSWIFLPCTCFWKPALSPACSLWVYTYDRAGIIWLHIKPGDFSSH